MQIARKVVSYLNISGEIVSIILLVEVLVLTFTQVIFRYVLNSPLSWSEELARLAFVWLNLIGASLAIRKKAHISFDFFVTHLSDQIRVIVELLTYLVITIYLILIFPASIHFVSFMNAVPSAALQWPLGVFFLSFPVASIMMIINCVAEIAIRMMSFMSAKER